MFAYNDAHYTGYKLSLLHIAIGLCLEHYVVINYYSDD